MIQPFEIVPDLLGPPQFIVKSKQGQPCNQYATIWEIQVSENMHDLVWPFRVPSGQPNSLKWKAVHDFLFIINTNHGFIMHRLGNTGLWIYSWPCVTFQAHYRSTGMISNWSWYITSYSSLMVTKDFYQTVIEIHRKYACPSVTFQGRSRSKAMAPNGSQYMTSYPCLIVNKGVCATVWELQASEIGLGLTLVWPFRVTPGQP